MVPDRCHMVSGRCQIVSGVRCQMVSGMSKMVSRSAAHEAIITRDLLQTLCFCFI